MGGILKKLVGKGRAQSGEKKAPFHGLKAFESSETHPGHLSFPAASMEPRSTAIRDSFQLFFRESFKQSRNRLNATVEAFTSQRPEVLKGQRKGYIYHVPIPTIGGEGGNMIESINSLSETAVLRYVKLL